MTDPLFSVLLMVAGITGALLLFAGLVSVAENIARHIPPGVRSALIHSYIWRNHQ